MEKKRRPKAGDFREFVFAATGKETEPATLSYIDVYDNLMAELDRLEALAKLLEDAAEDLEAETSRAVGAILRDIRKKMGVILDLGLAASRRG
jgi:hypothetical protein